MWRRQRVAKSYKTSLTSSASFDADRGQHRASPIRARCVGSAEGSLHRRCAVRSTGPAANCFLFGTFLLDPRGSLFLVDERGTRVPQKIGSRAFDVLSVLVERGGQLVSKEEIMATAWQGSIVEDGNLTVQISALRRLLDPQRQTGSCIQT